MGRNWLSKLWLERQFNITQTCLLAFYCQIHTLHDRSRSHWVQYRIHQGFEIGHHPRNYLHFYVANFKFKLLHSQVPSGELTTHFKLRFPLNEQQSCHKKKEKQKSTTMHVCSNKEHNCTVNTKYYFNNQNK